MGYVSGRDPRDEIYVQSGRERFMQCVVGVLLVALSLLVVWTWDIATSKQLVLTALIAVLTAALLLANRAKGGLNDG